MGLSVNVQVAPETKEICISCEDKKWSKRHFPLVNAPLTRPLFLHDFASTPATLYGLFNKLSASPNYSDNHLKLSQLKATGFSLTVEKQSLGLNMQIKQCFNQVFHLNEIEKLADLVPQEVISNRLKNEFNYVCLMHKLDLAAQSTLHDKLKRNYGLSAYEFLHRLPTNELSSLIRYVECLHIDTQELDTLRRGFLRDSYFQERNLSFRAIKAFMHGKIELDRLATLLLFAECKTHLPASANCQKYIFQLKSQGSKFNQSASDLIYSSLQNYWSQAEFDTFLESVQKLPSTLTYFFKIPCPIELDQSKFKAKLEGMKAGTLATEQRPSIVEYFYQNMNFRLFLLPSETPNQVEMLILPPHLVYLLLQAKFGEFAMKPQFVMGPSKPEHFARTDVRDASAPLEKMISAPEMADSYPCNRVTFYYHDVAYHLFVESLNLHRPAWAELGALYKAKRRFGLWEKTLDRDCGLYFKLAKLDTPEYSILAKRPVHKWLKQRTKAELFWVALAFFKEVKLEHHPEQKFFLKLAAEQIIQNEESWKTQYGISYADLADLINQLESNPTLQNQEKEGFGALTLKPLKELFALAEPIYRAAKNK